MELFIAVYAGTDPIEHSCFIWANDMDEVERMYREHSPHLKDAPKLDVLVFRVPRRFGVVSIKEAFAKAQLYADHAGQPA